MIVEIDGIDNVRDLAATLERSAQRAGADGAKVVRRCAAQVETFAKALAPVDTGLLRNSISTDMVNDGRFASVTAEIGPTANHGSFVELGTSRQAPQPYMFPAGDRVEPIFVAAMQALAEPNGNG